MSTSTFGNTPIGSQSAKCGIHSTIRCALQWARLHLRLRHLLFAIFLVLATVPIVGLAIWDQSVAYKRELTSARERHLLMARSLAVSLSRYVQDVRATFALAFESGGMSSRLPGLEHLLDSMDVAHVCVVDANGSIEACLGGVVPAQPASFPPALLAVLRQLAANASGQVAITPLERDSKGDPVFYLTEALLNGRLGIGMLTHDYVLRVQQQIAFGGHGHATVIDSTGRIIAHPMVSWVDNERDISRLPVVQDMMHGKTGVTQFYSPAMNAMMVAGYAVVPATGWGVMVSQPLAEFRERARQVNELAMVVALAAVVGAALLSWLLANYLARPVSQVSDTAEAVLGGNDKVSVPAFRGFVPREFQRLRVAFNSMLDDLRRRHADTTVALRQAERSSIAKSQFLANMSHEIRTPLHGVVGLIELLQQTELSPIQMHYVGGARQSGEALLALIDEVLDLSKIEAGHVELEHMPFKVPSLVQDVLLMFDNQAKSKGLSLTASIPGDLDVMLIGDAHRLSRILINLVANALKFTAEGTVVVRVGSSKPDDGQLLVRFEVEDTGIGIPEFKQKAIFEAFFQVDTSTTRRYGGTGLGLSIARQLCHLMGGEIGVESEVGVGSTFWFSVPLLKAPDSATPAELDAEGRHREPTPATVMERPVNAAQRAFEQELTRLGRSTIRILLVEDNPIGLKVTRALLEAIGCQVMTAQNGLEAVAVYRDDRFDVVLMDCQMPEMDGYQAARAIRAVEAMRGYHTPIVALTANAMVGSRDACLAAGMDDQLTKPLTLAELSARLLHWLGPAANQGAVD